MSIEPFRVRPGINQHSGKHYIHDAGGNIIATVHDVFGIMVNKVTANEMAMCKVMVMEITSARNEMQEFINNYDGEPADIQGLHNSINSLNAILAKLVRP